MSTVASAPVAEGGTSGDSLSWTGSQLVNDALAKFQQAASQMPPEQQADDFLSVTGTEYSRNSDLAELEMLRARVAALELREGRRQRGSFWGS